MTSKRDALNYGACCNRELNVPPTSQYVVYPVRGIRRKNVGELLLWSLLLDETYFAVTLAPLNPEELHRYQHWESLAASLSLPIRFDAGPQSGLSVTEQLCAADGVITTSVAEGFGMVYLEACLANRHLLGRNLPSVTEDFTAAGLQFPGLADNFRIPQELVQLDALRVTYADLLSKTRASYGLDASELPDQLPCCLADGSVDFGGLDMATQTDIINRAANDDRLRDSIRELNPNTSFLSNDISSAIHTENRKSIERSYGFPTIASCLAAIYQSGLESTTAQVQLSPEIAVSVLHQFSQADRLLPVRLEQ